MSESSMAYRVCVPGMRTRSARTKRGAERAMGQMMTQVPNGTVGWIHHAGRFVTIGVADTLGWMPLPEWQKKVAS